MHKLSILRDDNVALLDVAFCCQRIVAATSTIDLPQFMSSIATQDQVLYRLIIMGEAVKRLSAEFRTQHPQVTWQAIAGARDVLIHSYERVDLEAVWEMATLHVPRLLEHLLPILPDPSRD